MCNSLPVQFQAMGTQLPSLDDVSSNAKVVPTLSLGKTFRQDIATAKQNTGIPAQISVENVLGSEQQAEQVAQASNEPAKKTIESLHQNEDLAGSKLPFLWKLHILLDDVEATGNDHIVSWLEHGRSFKVYRPKSFMAQIVPRYFKQSKYKSFQRQLHLYEFTRMQYGPEAGSYSHPLFLRGQPTLCLSLSPIKIKGKARQSSDASYPIAKTIPQRTIAFAGKRAPQSTVTSAVLSKREQEEWVAKINRMLVKGSTEMRQSPQPSVVSLNEPESVSSQQRCDKAVCDDTCCVFGSNFYLLDLQHDVNKCMCCSESVNNEEEDLDLLLAETE